jgi:small-conductance mechanosensitive channel
MLGAGVLVLQLVLLLALPASAQDITPVLVERVGSASLVADVGAPAEATFQLFNLHSTADHYVTVAVEAPKHWRANASADRFFVGPRNATNVTFALEPLDTPRSSGTFVVTFTLVNGETGVTTRESETLEVASGAAPRVIGVLPNPLGPPLDNAYGTFLLDMLFWVAIGVGSVIVSKWLTRLVTIRASTTTSNDVFGKLRRPIFFLVLLLGLSRSFAILPRNAVTVFIAKFLIAVAVTVFGLYVLYRGLEAGLLYYQREIAPKTATKMDDVIVPAVRKVGLVFIYIVGIVLTLRNLGWDPTLIFAGAGIAGLVIAFAAQDTFSNLFSGVFLMLDQPFVEGDWITLETGDEAMVADIGLRTTRLYNNKLNQMVIVPNNQLATRRIINHNAPDPRFRMQVEVAVTRDADPLKVERVLIEVARAHPECLSGPAMEPSVRFFAMHDGVLRFAIRLYVHGFEKRGRVTSELRFAIYEAFAREGIEVAYPTREILVRHEDAGSLRPLNQNP